MKKIAVIIGHPFADSLSHALAEKYIVKAKNMGAEVRVIDLATISFEPIPRNLNQVRVRGIDQLDELQPSIAHMVRDLEWADHFAFFYPVWWGTFPAVLKAFMDRAILSGVAFRYGKTGVKWDRLWRGKTARIVLTMDAPPLWHKLTYRAPGENALKRATLWYVGVKTIGITRFAPVRFSTSEIREQWLATAAKLGTKDASR